VTRWLVSPLPSISVPGEPASAGNRWRLELWRARGGAPAIWIVEACDATGHVALLPRWAMERRGVKDAGQSAHKPAVLAVSIGSRRLVSAVNPAAEAQGILPGCRWPMRARNCRG